MISIVDDDESVRNAIGNLVRSIGYEPTLFSCAEDFLASAQLDDTCCLITDVHMQGMSGLDLQFELINTGQHMPIIFVTAYPEESIRKRAKAAGATCYLSKPFDGQTMIDCIEEILHSPNGHTCN
ncbi:response regulator [Pseudomonas sp. p50]|nr:response regulator [Pseudomonas sp. p50(2008)]